MEEDVAAGNLLALGAQFMPIWGVGPRARAVGLMITNRRITAGAVVLSVAGLSASSALGNGFRLPSQDAFATARGEAFVATADNASAVYYNPAGLTQLEGLSFRSGIYGIYLDPTYTSSPPAVNPGKFHIEDQWAVVPQFFSAYTPTDWPLSFGLGVYPPFGGDVTWPEDVSFRKVALSGSLKYLTINPAVALKLGPGFSIAGGVMVNYADLEMEQGLELPFYPFDNYFRFKGHDWSVGYNLGLLWEPHERVTLGATFRSSTTFTMDGHTEYADQPAIQPGRVGAHADFKFPLTGVVGVSYRPTPKWNFEFDADYTDWSSFGTTTIYQAPDVNPDIVRDIPVTLDWQPSWMYEFGVTRYFDNGWHVSAGYVFSENSVPDAYYSPLAADLDRHFFSVGTGFKAKRFSFDVAYQFGYGPAHTVTGSSPSANPLVLGGPGPTETADGKYEFISHAVMVTVGLQF